MLRIDHVETYGWEAAIRGMRNPKNSWEKSDTAFYSYPEEGMAHQIGPNDMKLMRSLADAGQVHGKFLRMICVTLDVTAPLYWWKEFDTYKVGTVANSCSTMHKIHAKEFTLEDFSVDHMTAGNIEGFKMILNCLNTARQNFLETKDKLWWWQMIQTLPSSYNQKRTVMLNYTVLKNIYEYRKDHKLDEWHVFCDMIRSLPYAKELIIGEE